MEDYFLKDSLFEKALEKAGKFEELKTYKIEKRKRYYNLGLVPDCPYCSKEDSEHSCRHCYNDTDKKMCWENDGYCEKCFLYIKDEIPKIQALKKELNINCKCDESNCAKCLMVNCKEGSCFIHTIAKKEKYKRVYKISSTI